MMNQQKTMTEKINLLALQNTFFQGLESKGRSPNTLKNYRTDLECFNQYLLSNKMDLSLAQMSSATVEQYGPYLENKYKSDNSRRRRVQALRLFFDFLVEKGLFSSNPVRKIPTSPKFLDIPRPTSFVDVKTLWQYLLEESQSKNSMARLLAKRNQVMILLVYGAGLKVSDLHQLKTDQIFLSKNKEQGPRVLVTPSKRDPYTVPLPSVFDLVYQSYQEEVQQEKEKSMIEFNQVLFNANPYRILSGGLSPRGIEIVLEDLKNKLMIELTPKSLRQSCIFKWLKQKRNDSLIKEWMGVAPSYSLKPYKNYLSSHVHDDLFLGELYQHYLKKDYSKT